MQYLFLFFVFSYHSDFKFSNFFINFGNFRKKSIERKRQVEWFKDQMKISVTKEFAYKIGCDCADGTLRYQEATNQLMNELSRKVKEKDLSLLDFSNRANIYTMDDLLRLINDCDGFQLRCILMVLAGINYRQLSFYKKDKKTFDYLKILTSFYAANIYNLIQEQNWDKCFAKDTVEYRRCLSSVESKLIKSGLISKKKVERWVRLIKDKSDFYDSYNLKELENELIQCFYEFSQQIIDMSVEELLEIIQNYYEERECTDVQLDQVDIRSVVIEQIVHEGFCNNELIKLNKFRFMKLPPKKVSFQL